MRINQTKGVNDDLSLDALNGIDDDGNGTFVKLFKALKGKSGKSEG